MNVTQSEISSAVTDGTAPSPQHLNAIRPEDLWPGDILLHRPHTPKFHQPLIAKYTNSPFTHASIYLGDGKVAHSTPPIVRIDPVAEATTDDMYAGVLRSPAGFGPERIAILNDFVETLVAKDTAYDFTGIAGFVGRNKRHFEDVLKQVRDNYGQYATRAEFEERSYFCSALIAACFAVVGIIGESAQVMYPPDVLAPGDLHRDGTFGWLVGYLIQDGHNVPEEDPLLTITRWADL